MFRQILLKTIKIYILEILLISSSVIKKISKYFKNIVKRKRKKIPEHFSEGTVRAPAAAMAKAIQMFAKLRNEWSCITYQGLWTVTFSSRPHDFSCQQFSNRDKFCLIRKLCVLVHISSTTTCHLQLCFTRTSLLKVRHEKLWGLVQGGETGMNLF